MAELSGVAGGILRGMKNAQDMTYNEERIKEARLSQQLAQQKFDEYKSNAPLRKSQAELETEQLKEEVRKLQYGNLRDSTYRAFDMYDNTGDTKYLNKFLQDAKRNPIGAEQYGDVARVDPITDNESVRQLFQSSGFVDSSRVFQDPNLAKNFVVATDSDGNQSLVDMSEMYAGTGYTQHMEETKLKTLKERAAINKLLRDPAGTGDHRLIADIAESEGISFSDAARKFFEMKRTVGVGNKSGDYRLIHELSEEKQIPLSDAMREFYGMRRSGVKSGSTVERVAEDLRAKDPTLTLEQSLKDATKLTESRTSDQKNLGSADLVRSDIDKAVGGDFFSADMNDPKLRRIAGPKITELEKYTGRELSQEDKRVARQMRSLISLGGSAGSNLSDEETGILDNTLVNLKKYISDEVDDGTEGIAAYETFRNSLRNALYGASLTASEITAFNNAAGSLKQKTGPVLKQLRTQMSDVRSQLQSIYDFNDEYVAHYYLGRSREDIDKTIEALDSRIKYFENYTKTSEEFEKKTFTKQPAAAKTTTGDLPPLDEVWDTLGAPSK